MSNKEQSRKKEFIARSKKRLPCAPMRQRDEATQLLEPVPKTEVLEQAHLTFFLPATYVCHAGKLRQRRCV
jgi:hypothetical protein